MINANDIIETGRYNLKDCIDINENERFVVDPLNSNNSVICLSLPVKCFPKESNTVVVIPTFININSLDGKLIICFDKTSSTLYTSDSIGFPMVLKDNIFKTNKFDKLKYDCCIENIEINNNTIKDIPEFKNIRYTSNVVTNGNKLKYNINKESIPMYIENQLTFPNSSELFYILNNTYVIGTKSKWLISNTTDSFKGSMHIYTTVVTTKDINSINCMRNNYMYVQIKRKFSSSIGDMIACTGKLYRITINDLQFGGDNEF